MGFQNKVWHRWIAAGLGVLTRRLSSIILDSKRKERNSSWGLFSTPIAGGVVGGGQKNGSGRIDVSRALQSHRRDEEGSKDRRPARGRTTRSHQGIKERSDVGRERGEGREGERGAGARGGRERRERERLDTHPKIDRPLQRRMDWWADEIDKKSGQWEAGRATRKALLGTFGNPWERVQGFPGLHCGLCWITSVIEAQRPGEILAPSWSHAVLERPGCVDEAIPVHSLPYPRGCDEHKSSTKGTARGVVAKTPIGLPLLLDSYK